jgi:NADP-dependent 3-hydroxy acid dehydrogenase YdfG
MEIKDKIAIVTGASAGIGLALARLLAEKARPSPRASCKRSSLATRKRRCRKA